MQCPREGCGGLCAPAPYLRLQVPHFERNVHELGGEMKRRGTGMTEFHLSEKSGNQVFA
jgi:hypothetical protein